MRTSLLPQWTKLLSVAPPMAHFKAAEAAAAAAATTAAVHLPKSRARSHPVAATNRQFVSVTYKDLKLASNKGVSLHRCLVPFSWRVAGEQNIIPVDGFILLNVLKIALIIFAFLFRQSAFAHTFNSRKAYHISPYYMRLR